ILSDKKLLIELIIDELTEIKNKFADDRRTVIDKNLSASIDEVIKIIKSSKTDQDAQNNLSTRFNLITSSIFSTANLRPSKICILSWALFKSNFN
ncbi:hypothetical protein, partial [Mycoplasmopsis bovis]|uniref:hypothetical protein n=1 Tax=Mycoplasmopsis bovis TaxID=28903 RepID=UPI003D282FC1